MCLAHKQLCSFFLSNALSCELPGAGNTSGQLCTFSVELRAGQVCQSQDERQSDGQAMFFLAGCCGFTYPGSRVSLWQRVKGVIPQWWVVGAGTT